MVASVRQSHRIQSSTYSSGVRDGTRRAHKLIEPVVYLNGASLIEKIIHQCVSDRMEEMSTGNNNDHTVLVCVCVCERDADQHEMFTDLDKHRKWMQQLPAPFNHSVKLRWFSLLSSAQIKLNPFRVHWIASGRLNRTDRHSLLANPKHSIRVRLRIHFNCPTTTDVQSIKVNRTRFARHIQRNRLLLRAIDVMATCFARFTDGNINYIITRRANPRKFLCFVCCSPTSLSSNSFDASLLVLHKSQTWRTAFITSRSVSLRRRNLPRFLNQRIHASFARSSK